MIDKFKEAIETVNWFVYQLQSGNLKDVPEKQLSELRQIKERLEFLFEEMGKEFAQINHGLI